MCESDAQPWTVLRLVNWTRDYLTKADVDSPRISAEVLLADVLGCRRIDLYARYDDQPDAGQLAAYRRLVRRAAEHEPIAYLVGHKEFYSLRFAVCPDVLIPRPETEIVVDQAVAHLRALRHPGHVWDVAAGCGCIGIAVAVNVTGATLLSTDISPAAVAVARQNADAYGLGNRGTFAVADLLTAPDGVDADGAFDVITANPPYVPDAAGLSPVVRHEPVLALRGGPDGLDLVRRVVDRAPAVLNSGGRLIMEFGIEQCEAVCDLIDETEDFEDPQVTSDHQTLPRVVNAVRR